MFLNFNALLILIFSIIISLFLYKNEIKTKLGSIANFNQLLVWVVSLGYTVIELSNLSDVNKLGQITSLFLLSNFYAGILNIVIKTYDRIIINK